MMARPLNTLTPRTTAGVMRARKRDTPMARTHHHAAGPNSTPATTSAGLARPVPTPNPSVAASAANETIVAGLVIVRPRVDAYAPARLFAVPPARHPVLAGA